MRCADGKYGFPSPHPHTGHGHSTELLRRLHAWAQRIHASPHDEHCTFQHRISMDCKEKKSAKSPRRTDQDVSIPVLLGTGESSSSPPQSTTQLVWLTRRSLRYGAPGHHPPSLFKPWGQQWPHAPSLRCGRLHGQHPCRWGHRRAGGPGAGANPPRLSGKYWPSKANLKPELSSWPPVCTPRENFWEQKNKSQTPKNNPELLQQGDCILRYAEYYQTQRPPAKAGEGMKAPEFLFFVLT